VKVAVFPGKFNPVHRGHLGIMEDASKLFDRIVVAVECDNIQKSMRYHEQVEEALRQAGAPRDRVIVLPYDGSLVEFTEELMTKDQGYQEVNEYAIVKGLRNVGDLEQEKAIVRANEELGVKVCTVFMLSRREDEHLSSTLVKDMMRFGKKLGNKEDL
jgi:pantetheine-phosphate adenylyltransferase